MKIKILTIMVIMLFVLGFSKVTNAGINEYTTTFPKSIVKNNFNHSVIIIAGGRGETDWLQPIFERDGENAYNTFKKLGYSDDSIMYLSRNLSLPGVDCSDTLINISKAITEWLVNRINNQSNYCIYIVSHGNKSIGKVTVKDGYIYALDLSRWLDKVKEYNTGTIVINSCFSGKFIPYLSDPKRIIMTDTDSFNHGFTDFYNSIFSKAFFDKLSEGASYGKAWIAADKAYDRLVHYIYIPGMKNWLEYKNPTLYEKVKNIRIFWFYYWLGWQINYREGNPLIEDNGDYIGHGTWRTDKLPLQGDGSLALETYP